MFRDLKVENTVSEKGPVSPRNNPGGVDRREVDLRADVVAIPAMARLSQNHNTNILAILSTRFVG